MSVYRLSERSGGVIGTIGPIGGSGVFSLQERYALTADNFKDVSLYLKMNGANGSTTFYDSSLYGHTVTAYGDAAISTTQSKFGGASAAFDGTADYLLSVGKPEHNLNIGDFTLESWVYLNNLSADQDPIGCGNTTTTGYQTRIKATTGYVQFLVVGGASITTTTGIAATTWTHVAIVRSGTTVTIYLNGVDAGGSGTVANSGVVTTEPLVIGLNRLLLVNPLNGYIDSLRITKGQARYTGNFTPPQREFLP